MSQIALTDFLNSLTSFEPREDGYDLSLWSSFSPEERTSAEDALMKAASGGDPRALVTLGRLNVKRSIEIVREQTQSQSEWVRFAAHRALLKLEGSSSGMVESAIASNFYTRFGAVMELAEVVGENAEKALLNALDDSDPLVRSRALESLIERHGLISLTRNESGKTLLETPLKTLDTLLMSDIAPLWQQAAWEARHIFTAIANGKSADDLGLRYVQTGPDNFRKQVRDAFFDEEQPFDPSFIAAIAGHDRHWAEAFLALQLDPNIRNIRAVTTLASLGARWVLPALETSVAGLPTDDPYAVAVAVAIETLTNPSFI